MSLLPPPSTLPPGATVDAYLRDSGGPTQERSTAQQLTEITAYCKTHGLLLRQAYTDEARSGASTAGRDDFNSMLDTYRIEDQRPNGLLLWNYARFTRDLDDAIYYKSWLKTIGITVHSLTDPVPEGKYGRIIEFFIDISNEEKRRQTSEDAKRGLRDLVTAHRCVPGSPPRGFTRTPVNTGTRRDGTPRIAHRWDPDPDLIPTIQKAFQMKAAGATLSQIHKQTRIYGSLNSYRTFFLNPIYIGVLEYGSLTINDYCTPIVDIDTWRRVQNTLKAHGERHNPHKFHPRRVNSPYLLSGLAYCQACGAPLYGNTVTRPTRANTRDEAYRCSRGRRHRDCKTPRIARKPFEKAVLDTIREYILLPDNFEAIHAIALNSQAEFQTQREARKKANRTMRTKISRKIANISKAIANAGHSDALLNALKALEKQRAELLVEDKQLKIPMQSLPQLTANQLTAFAQNLATQLETKTPEHIRTILRGFIHKVHAQKKDGAILGTITYYYPPTLPKSDKPPPFEITPAEKLPSGLDPVGAPRYRQTFTHPIISKPRS